MSASALCEVKVNSGAWTATTNGIDVVPGDDVYIRPASLAGVGSWVVTCWSTDETTSPATINALVTSTGYEATFTVPEGAGKAMLFRSTVVSPSNVTTTASFGIFAPADSGRRVLALDQTYESNATYGWAAEHNDLVRNGAYGDYSVIREKKVATTNATPTAITFDWTGIADIPDDCVVACTATIIGRNTDDGSKFCRLELARTMACVAGTGTFNGSTREFDAERVSTPGTLATIERDAGTLRPYIEVTGIAATNIAWKAILEYNTLVNADGAEPPPPPPFDLASYSWSLYIDGDDRTSSSLPGTASAGSSGTASHRLDSNGGNTIAAGSAFGAHNSVDWQSDEMWTYGFATGSTFLNAAAYTIVWVGDLQGFSATGSAYHDVRRIVGSRVGAYWGFGAYNDGVNNKIIAGHYDGGFKNVSMNASTGKQMIAVRYDGTNIKIRVNKGAWTSTAAGNVSDLTNDVSSYSGAGSINGDTALLLISDTSIADGDLDDIYDGLQADYGI